MQGGRQRRPTANLGPQARQSRPVFASIVNFHWERLSASETQLRGILLAQYPVSHPVLVLIPTAGGLIHRQAGGQVDLIVEVQAILYLGFDVLVLFWRPHKSHALIQTDGRIVARPGAKADTATCWIYYPLAEYQSQVRTLEVQWAQTTVRFIGATTATADRHPA
jgi:hypothetical protein